MIIRSKANGNINPLVKQISNFGLAILIFIKDNIGVKIQSVDWENVVIANISQVNNFSVELNKCHFDMSEGFSFIHFSSNIKGIGLKIFDSQVNGNWQWQEYFSISFNFDSLPGDKTAEFINSSFKGVSIEGKRLSNVHIERCFFENAAISIQSTRHLYIDQATFEHARRNYLFEPDSSYILKVGSSNATLRNCEFRNNTNSVMNLFNSTASIENTTFVNNINVFSKGVFLEARLSNVSFWGVNFNQNEKYDTLIRCVDSYMQIKHSLIKKTMRCIQIVLMDYLNYFCCNSTNLSIVDTVISENTCTLVENDSNQDYFSEVTNHGIVIANSLLDNNTVPKYTLSLLVPILISDTIISFNKVAQSIVYSRVKTTIKKTKFIYNSMKFAVQSTGLFIQSCNFENNTVKGSLIFILTLDFLTWSGSSTIKYTNITRNIIFNEVIETWFGKHNVTIYRLDVRRNSFRSCFAIFNGKALIQHSVIIDNNATGVGKLVNYQEKSAFSPFEFKELDKGLEIKDVNSSFIANEIESPLFSIELQGGFLRLENITLQLPETIAIHALPVIDISTDIRNVRCKPYLNIFCPVNYNPYTNTDITRRRFGYSLSCESCPRGLYSSYGGSEHLNGVNYTLAIDDITNNPHASYVLTKVSSVKNSTDCTPCPPGATCNYKLLSRGNFYGFLEKNGKYKFITCPNDYCCSQGGAPCTSYDTCNVNRTGLLCGSCTEGNYISYFSNKCIEASKCTALTRLIFWIFYFVSAAFLTLVLCFLEDVLCILNMMFLFIKRKVLKICFKRNQNSRNNGNNSERELLEIHTQSATTETNDEKTQNRLPNQIPYSAIFNILVSFYQLQSLLEVPIDDKDQWSFTSLVSNFFNLDIMLRRVDKYCPVRNKNAIFREILKNFFLPLSMILTILTIMHIRKFCIYFKAYCPRIMPKFAKHSQTPLSLTERLYIGYYVVITFSYEKLASIAFRLIHCVEIGGSSILYFAGDIKCYRYWQKLDICFLIFWVIPFPAAVMVGYYLLKRNKISVWIFMTCVTFPPLIIAICMIVKCSNFSLKIKSKGEHEGNINKSLENIFEEPYSEKYFWWETWTLYERLIVACIATFLIDPVIRLCSLTPVLLLFLWFHNWAKPHKPSMKILFHLDVLSYICLCFSLVANMIRAIVYIYSLPLTQYPIDKALAVSQYLEYIFTPLWPLILYFIVIFTMKKLKKN